MTCELGKAARFLFVYCLNNVNEESTIQLGLGGLLPLEADWGISAAPLDHVTHAHNAGVHGAGHAVVVLAVELGQGVGCKTKKGGGGWGGGMRVGRRGWGAKDEEGRALNSHS